MEEPNAVIAPDPAADFVAWEAAELAGKNTGETTIPAGGGEKPPETPAEKPEEIASEPAGEPAKAEPLLEPEAGKPKESESEKKAEQKAKPEGEDKDPAPNKKWWRDLDRQRKRQIRELREETDALRAELAAKTKAEPAAAQPVKEPSVIPPAEVEPVERTFDNYEIFEKAHRKWEIRQEARAIAAEEVGKFQRFVKEQLDAEDEAIRNRQAAAAQAALDAKWVQDVERGIERHPDFEEVVLENTNLPERGPVLDRAVWESEYTAEVMYHLAKHPEEILRIRVLQPHQIGKEVGKIEAQFSEKAKTPETKTQVTSPQRPNPTTRIGGGNSIAAIKDQNDPEVLKDYPTWERLERAQHKRS